MVGVASLVNSGSVCTCSSWQFEGSYLLVRRVPFSKKFYSFPVAWLSKRWHYGSVCRYPVSTDFVAEQGTSVSLDPTFRGTSDDDADLVLKPAPKPQLKSGPSAESILELSASNWDGSKLGSDSKGENVEDRNKVIESLGQVLEKADKLEDVKEVGVSVSKLSPVMQGEVFPTPLLSHFMNDFNHPIISLQNPNSTKYTSCCPFRVTYCLDRFENPTHKFKPGPLNETCR